MKHAVLNLYGAQYCGVIPPYIWVELTCKTRSRFNLFEVKKLLIDDASDKLSRCVSNGESIPTK